jgi:hypothetical protein
MIVKSTWYINKYGIKEKVLFETSVVFHKDSISIIPRYYEVIHLKRNEITDILLHTFNLYGMFQGYNTFNLSQINL